jgi:hypothetical protein
VAPRFETLESRQSYLPRSHSNKPVWQSAVSSFHEFPGLVIGFEHDSKFLTRL